MSCTMEMIERVYSLTRLVHEYAAQYRHSRPLIVQQTAIVLNRTKHHFTLNYDIKDLMFLGALTHSSVLMTGDTDKGKTTLAKLVMNGLFGEQDKGWHKINIDIEYTRDMLFEVDFDVIRSGKKSSEGLYEVYPSLLLPGFIVDELNRSHAKVANQVMHVFDRDISGPNGVRASIGYPYDDDKRYQFQVAAMNEGEEFTGTFDIDKAMRRRTIIEIPLDAFSPTGADRRALPKVAEISSGVSLSTKWKSEPASAVRSFGILPWRMRWALVMMLLLAACRNTSVKRTTGTTPLSIKSRRAFPGGLLILLVGAGGRF